MYEVLEDRHKLEYYIKSNNLNNFVQLLHTDSIINDLYTFVTIMVKNNMHNWVIFFIENYTFTKQQIICIVIQSIKSKNLQITQILFEHFNDSFNLIEQACFMKICSVSTVEIFVYLLKIGCNLDSFIFNACHYDRMDLIEILVQVVDNQKIICRIAYDINNIKFFKIFVDKFPFLLEKQKLFNYYFSKRRSCIIEFYFECGYFYAFDKYLYIVCYFPYMLKLIIKYNLHKTVLVNIKENIKNSIIEKNFEIFIILNTLTEPNIIVDCDILKQAIVVCFKCRHYAHYKDINFIEYYLKKGICINHLYDFVVDYVEDSKKNINEFGGEVEQLINNKEYLFSLMT